MHPFLASQEGRKTQLCGTDSSHKPALSSGHSDKFQTEAWHPEMDNFGHESMSIILSISRQILLAPTLPYSEESFK